MRYLLIFLPTLLFAQSATNIQVIGINSTQAIVTYTATSESSCNISASLTLSGTALNDVNATLFPNSNVDLLRASTIVNGLNRTIVIGTRSTAIPTSGGNYLSLALPADSLIYASIDCGTPVNYTFNTTDVFAGIGTSDPFLTDSSNPGGWPAPSTDGSTAGEVFYDPQTGAHIYRLTYPGFGFYQQSNQAFSTAYNQDKLPCDVSGAGYWSNPCNVIGSSSYATISGSNGWLVIRNNNFAFGQFGGTSPKPGTNLLQLQFSATALSTASSDSLDVCLSMNGGHSCASIIKTVSLPTLVSTITVGRNDTAFIGIDDWIYQSNPHVARYLATTHQGNVTVSGAVVTNTGGDNFSSYWATNGGRIRLSNVSSADACSNGSDLIISSMSDGKNITLTTIPGSFVYYCSENFAIMVRAHTGNTGTTSINNAKFTATSGEGATGTDEAFPNLCSNKLYSSGYLCLVPLTQGWGGLGFVDTTTNESSMILSLNRNSRSGTDGWTQGACPSTGPEPEGSFDDRNSITTPTWYCTASDNGGNPIILQVQYSGSLSAQTFNREATMGTGCSNSGNQAITCSNGSNNN